MTAGWKALVVAALAAVLLVPGLTIHAAAGHLVSAGPTVWPLHDPGLIPLGLFALASLLPLGLLTAKLPSMWRSQRFLERYARSGDRQRLHGFDVVVLPDDRLTVCAAGLLRPRILVSRSAVATLGDEQLQAALLHERAHIAAGDTLWHAALALFASAYAFVPGVRTAVSTLRTAAELRADRQALAAGASRFALFDALVAVGSQPSPSTFAAGLGDGALEMRLRHLAGVGEAVPSPRPLLMGGAIAGLLLLPLAAHALLTINVICQGTIA